MFYHNFKLIIRQFWQHRTHSFINVLGLTLGTASCMAILLFAAEQYRYDRHHDGKEDIFRVVTDVPGDRGSWQTARLSPPIAPAMGEEFPEVESWTRLVDPPDVSHHILSWDNTSFYEQKGYYVDSTFFDVFTYRWVEGDPASALDEPYTVVLTLAVAEKLFGRQSAVGQSIRINNRFGDNEFKVDGVVDPTAMPSHIRGHFYMSLNSGGIGEYVRNNNNWAGNNFILGYVKLKPQAEAAAVAAKLPDLLDRHGGNQLRELGMRKELSLEPITDIHLYSERENQLETTVSSRLLFVLLTIAGFIQFIACVNFMNLTTARSTLRAKEVGIRKTIGADRRTLAGQFLLEALLLSGAAFLLALPVLWIGLPWLNELTGSEITMGFIQYPGLWLLLAGLVFFTGLLAGSYPAFYLSGFRIIDAIRNNISRRNLLSAGNLRRGLVVLQFVISVGLVIGVIIIHQQLNFFQQQDLGFQKEQQIVVPFRTETSRAQLASFKQEVKQLPEVRAVSGARALPGQFVARDNAFYTAGESMDDSQIIKMIGADEDYLTTLQIPLLSGRDFRPSDTTNQVILNERALQVLDIPVDAAPGQEIYTEFEGERTAFRIIGVMADFHYRPLRETLAPLLLNYRSSEQVYHTLISVKTADYGGLLQRIEQRWQALNPDTPFEYSFLDDDLAQNYKAETNLARIISIFTFMAILISCLGLFGLSTFTIERRVKEIGIRKVMGATTAGIVSLLSKDFLRLVVVALLIAAPLAWYFMRSWLADFAYRVEIQWWVFALAGAVAILIAFLTVSFQSIKAALTNPVQSLRSE